MRFRTQQDVGAGIAEVFAEIGDFARLERQALRRNIEVVRTGPDDDPAKAAWRLTFSVRGKPRVVNAHVARFDPPNGYRIEGKSDGLDVDLGVELIALSKTRTRLVIACDLVPRTLTAKLMVQSMRLAKGNLDKRFETAVADYAGRIEDRNNA